MDLRFAVRRIGWQKAVSFAVCTDGQKRTQLSTLIQAIHNLIDGADFREKRRSTPNVWKRIDGKIEISDHHKR
jgi:hypothetical protein